jgi:FkbM family methyltransferase
VKLGNIAAKATSEMKNLLRLRSVLRGVLSHPLSQGAKCRRILRFASWQVRSRSSRTPIVIDWIEGSRLVASNGDTGVTGNIYTGLYDFKEMAFLLHALRPTDTFVDAGANAGCYSILASKVAGAHSIAFEPVPTTYARLLKNMEVNELNQLVTPVNKGLGDTEGMLRFSADQDSTNHVLSKSPAEGLVIEVPVQRIDDLGNTSIFAMKVDVEGYEVPVLRGAARLMSGCTLSVLILELNRSGERYGFSDAEAIRLARANGFEPFDYDPWSRRLSKLMGANPQSKNTILIRNIEQVSKRVRSARAFTVDGVSI